MTPVATSARHVWRTLFIDSHVSSVPLVCALAANAATMRTAERSTILLICVVPPAACAMRLAFQKRRPERQLNGTQSAYYLEYENSHDRSSHAHRHRRVCTGQRESYTGTGAARTNPPGRSERRRQQPP